MSKKFQIFLMTLFSFTIGVVIYLLIMIFNTTYYIKEFSEKSVPFEKIVYQTKIVYQPIPYIVDCPVYIYQDGHNNQVPCTNEELKMLVNLVWFESGNQDEEGRRYVVDTVLNRVRSKYFPNTIKEVISQHIGDVYQYGVVKRLNNGETHYLKENEKIVCEEIMNISNRDVIYFQRGCYHDCGKPILHHGDHYFSGLREGL